MIIKKRCANCGSSNLSLVGRSYKWWHILYKCLDCQKYTEYYIDGKHRFFEYFYFLLSYFILLVPPLVLIEKKPLISALYFFIALPTIIFLWVRFYLVGYTAIKHDVIPEHIGGLIRRETFWIILALWLILIFIIILISK